MSGEAKGPVGLQDSSWEPLQVGTDREDITVLFIIIVVIPVAVAIVATALLCYIFFGRREGVQKANSMTPEVQLNQYNTIKRATTNLRYMSERRDGPPPPLPISTTPEAAPNTPRVGGLDRHQPPPPYRLPPVYHTNISRRSSRQSGSKMTVYSQDKGYDDRDINVPSTSGHSLQSEL